MYPFDPDKLREQAVETLQWSLGCTALCHRLSIGSLNVAQMKWMEDYQMEFELKLYDRILFLSVRMRSAIDHYQTWIGDLHDLKAEPFNKHGVFLRETSAGKPCQTWYEFFHRIIHAERHGFHWQAQTPAVGINPTAWSADTWNGDWLLIGNHPQRGPWDIAMNVHQVLQGMISFLPSFAIPHALALIARAKVVEEERRGRALLFEKLDEHPDHPYLLP